jgi:hypothetical protein
MRGVGHLAAATRPASLRTEVKEVVAMFASGTCARRGCRARTPWGAETGGRGAAPPERGGRAALLQQPAQGIDQQHQPVKQQHPAVKRILEHSPPRFLSGGEPTPAFGLDLAVVGGYKRHVDTRTTSVPQITGEGSHPRSCGPSIRSHPWPRDGPDLKVRCPPIDTPILGWKALPAMSSTNPAALWV